MPKKAREKKGDSKPNLNPQKLPIPAGEDPSLFELSDDSDSTPGANNFMRLLNRACIKFEMVERAAEPTADFFINIDGVRIVAEVTDITPGPLDEALVAEANANGVCFPESIGPVTTRTKIARKCSQKKTQLEKSEYSTLPKILVLLNGCAQPYLRHDLVKTSLYEQIFDREALFLDARQRAISAIGCLDNGLDTNKIRSYMGEVRMRLYINPLALVPLNLDCFLGINNITCFWLDKFTNEIASNCKDAFQLFEETA